MSTENDIRSVSPSGSNLNDSSGHICLCQREPHIPRPRNAFILYRQHQHAQVVARHPGLANPDISKIIGEQWRRLPDKTKDDWKALAKEEKNRHSQQYPDYRYRPKRSGRLSDASLPTRSSSESQEAQPPCQKCGGKLMNSNTIIPGQDPAAAQIHQSGARMPPPRQTTSPPHSARIRPYAEMFGQYPHPRYEHPPLYTQPSPTPGASSNPENDPHYAKRRRYNSTVVTMPGRVLYQNYYRPQHDTYPVRTSAVPATAAMMAPIPGAAQLPLQRPHDQRFVHQRDPNLTLPPLQTPTNRPRANSQPAILSQTRTASVEATIMSIPILNKIMILSQVSPSFSTFNSSTTSQKPKGAIIAIEGINPVKVYDMTNTLADHLEKEGKFAVRIFGGPDPYPWLTPRSQPAGTSLSVSYPDFLNTIHQWHAISSEMIEYITANRRNTNTSTDGPSVVDLNANETSTTVGQQHYHYRKSSTQTSSQIERSSDSQSGSRTPISAVSPKTISQTAELSLKSPVSSVVAKDPKVREDSVSSKPRSRIPSAALAQQAEARARAQLIGTATAQMQSQPEATRLSLSSETTTSASAISSNSMQSHAHKTSSPEAQATQDSSPATNVRAEYSRFQRPIGPPITPSSRTSIPSPIPIAIVPHYQLTTVNAASIAMPITDAYSLHSHWQWLATLWRGCVGPDITIVIQNTSNDGESSASGSIGNNPTTGPGVGSVSSTKSAQSSTQTPSQSITGSRSSRGSATGVEVRLADCKTVIVNTDTSVGAVSGPNNDVARLHEDVESWEKAKRRVGFEVEEHLRK